MKTSIRTAIAIAITTVTLSACMPSFAAPASPASVETLLALTKSDQVLEVLYANLEQNVRRGMQAAVGNRTLTAEQQQVLQSLPAKFAQIYREEFGWAALKPLLEAVYAESFEQDDIDGLIQFYRSPLGQRFVDKQPVVAQRSAQAAQQLMSTLMPKIQAAMQEALTEAGVK